MERVLTDFVRALRNAGVRVSAAETMDAARALELVGYGDRTTVRDALASTLAKTPDEKHLLEDCFERFFVDSSSGARASVEPVAPVDPVDVPLLQVDGSASELQLQIAIAAAARRAGIDAMNSFTQRGLYVRRTLDQLGWQGLRQRLLALEGAETVDESRQLEAERLHAWDNALRERVHEHVERHFRLHADMHARELHDSVLRTTSLAQLEARDLERITQIVRRIARRLATRHARRRRVHRIGVLDVPRSLRSGIAHDGVLAELYWRRRRRDRPALIALCDISSSVQAHARFLLLFLYSLGDVLPRVRSFVFSARFAEVSELFREHPPETALMLAQRLHGRGVTDYGAALRGLLDATGRDLDRGANVVILGDGRNNRGDPALQTLHEIGRRAARLIWLVPEARYLWGTGDSEMLRYQHACTEVRVVQSIRQLEHFADDLLRRT